MKQMPWSYCPLSLVVSVLLVVIHCLDEIRACSEAEVQLSNDGQLYVISSPFFPDNYPANVDCVYHMVAPDDRLVRIFFSSFILENANDFNLCVYDYLAIYDGGSSSDPSLGKFCGRENPPTLISTGPELYIVFHSDSSIQKGGFRAEITDVALDYVEPVPTPSHASCFATYTEPRGVFYSPSFPDYYDNDEECAYVITSAKTDNIIMLRFPSFDLESSDNCVYDYVEVRDGQTETSSLLFRYCGSRLPEETISSTGPAIFVRFRSDSSGVYKGFYAEFADSDTGFQDNGDSGVPNQISVCDLSHAVLTEKGGTIVSHDTYPDVGYDSSQYCTVSIIGSRPNERIFFDLIVNDLPISGDCGASGDYLQLLDGDASVQNSQTLGYFCGNDVGRFSTQNSFAVIRFITDSVPNTDRAGFQLVYAIYYEDEAECEDGYWHCDNNRCISKGLVCDGFDHCRDSSDEQRGCERPSGNAWIIAVGVSAAIIILVIIVGCVLYKISNRKTEPSPNYNTSTNSESVTRRDSNLPPTRTLSAFTVTKEIPRQPASPNSDDLPPRYSSLDHPIHETAIDAENASPRDSSSSSAPPPSYLEIGRRGSKVRDIGSARRKKRTKLEPIARKTSSEGTNNNASNMSVDMDALPTGRRNILPPIKNEDVDDDT